MTTTDLITEAREAGEPDDELPRAVIWPCDTFQAAHISGDELPSAVIWPCDTFQAANKPGDHS